MQRKDNNVERSFNTLSIEVYTNITKEPKHVKNENIFIVLIDYELLEHSNSILFNLHCLHV